MKMENRSLFKKRLPLNQYLFFVLCNSGLRSKSPHQLLLLLHGILNKRRSHVHLILVFSFSHWHHSTDSLARVASVFRLFEALAFIAFRQRENWGECNKWKEGGEGGEARKGNACRQTHMILKNAPLPLSEFDEVIVLRITDHRMIQIYFHQNQNMLHKFKSSLQDLS